MPLSLIHPSSPVVGIWKITETLQEMLELFQNSTLYTDDLQKIQSVKRKYEWLAVRLLIKRLTGEERPVVYSEHGAPFLSGAPYHISISHTKGYAAVILSQSPRPGIDIEYRSERTWKLRTKYLSEKELTPFEALPPLRQTGKEERSPQATLATLCWCAKETAYKALQETGVDFIKHLHIAPFPLSEQGILSLQETKTHQMETYHINYRITHDYILTWSEAK